MLMRGSRIFLVCLLLLTHPLLVLCQLNDPVVRADTSSCTIPFNLVGKLIILQASADTSTGNFILDTGTPGLVLNNTYFRDYPVRSPHGSSGADINGSGEQVEQTSVPHFTLGTLHFHRTIADLLPLGHLEETRGIKILGLIGVAMFKECEVIIDYANRQMHIRHITRKEIKTYRNDLLSDTSKFHSWPIELRDNRILLNTTVAERKLKFAIDYAAETSVIDAGLPGRVLDSVEIGGRILLTGAGRRRIESLTGHLSGLRIGTVPVPALPVIVTRLENTCFGGMDCINGVLGYDYLSAGVIAINFRKRILYKSR